MRWRSTVSRGNSMAWVRVSREPRPGQGGAERPSPRAGRWHSREPRPTRFPGKLASNPDRERPTPHWFPGETRTQSRLPIISGPTAFPGKLEPNPGGERSSDPPLTPGKLEPNSDRNSLSDPPLSRGNSNPIPTEIPSPTLLFPGETRTQSHLLIDPEKADFAGKLEPNPDREETPEPPLSPGNSNPIPPTSDPRRTGFPGKLEANPVVRSIRE
jgi:hypothetical protein